jgi:CBS domain-containing protein
MRKTVADVMTSDPYVVSREASAVEAARMMDEQNIGSVPVVDGNRLVGIVTDRDIAVRVVAAALDPNRTTVGEIATANLHSATPDESIDEVYERMAVWRVRRIPVVDGDGDGQIVGMLAQADLVHELKASKAGQLVDEISQPGEPAFGGQEIGIT